MQLRRLPGNADYFFSIRRPETRFVSAFYERKRKGRGGRNEWSEAERISFEEFEHANDLAEEIFSDSPRGRIARGALNSIQHMRQLQSSWFQSMGHFLTVRPPISIIRQEHFNEDFAFFLRRIGVAEMPVNRVPADRAKVTSYREIPQLSALARANLLKWYEMDTNFYQDCQDWLVTQMSAGVGP